MHGVIMCVFVCDAMVVEMRHDDEVIIHIVTFYKKIEI